MKLTHISNKLWLTFIVLIAIVVLSGIRDIQVKNDKLQHLKNELERSHALSLNEDAYQRQFLTIAESQKTLNLIFKKRDINRVVNALADSEYHLNASHVKNGQTEFYSYSQYKIHLVTSFERIQKILNFLYVELTKEDLLFTLVPKQLTIINNAGEAETTILFELIYFNDSENR